MKYQLKVWKERNNGKVLKPYLSIKDAAYWQKRVRELLPEYYITCLVAK